MTWPKTRWHVVVVIATVVIPFLFFWKLFLPSIEERLIFRGDFLNQHYVWKSYALKEISDGNMPLWNPHVLGGVAFHANPQVGLFYPPTYLLMPFLNGPSLEYRALEAYQLAHLSWAGVGIFCLLGSFGVQRFAALTASLVIMFTGFFTTPGHHALVVTASWIPWVLLSIKKRGDSPNKTSIVWASASVAMLILGGHPQVAYYGIVLATIWAIWLQGVLTSLRVTAAAIVVGVMLSAIQWLPTLQLASDSNRAETDYAYSTTFDLSSYFFSGALVPRGQIILPGQDGATPLHLYVGVGTLLLAVIGLLLSQLRLRWFFAATATTGLFLSLGHASLLFDVFYLAVPGFSQFRIPYRLLGIYAIGMAGLAALGFEVVASPGPRARRRLRTILFGWWIVAAALVVWSAVTRGHLDSISLGPAQIERIVGAMYWTVALVIANGLVLTLRLWQPRHKIVTALFLAILALDLGAFVKDRAQHPASTLVRAGERPIHRLARSQAYLARHVSNSNLESYAMLHGTHFLGGQDSLIDRRYVELMERSGTSANILSILNAKYVGRTQNPNEYPWCGQRYASPLPILDVPESLSPAKLVLETPLSYSVLEILWSRLGDGGSAVAATIRINDKVHRLSGDKPLRISTSDPSLLQSITVDVPAGTPGIRIEDIELDLNPIGLLADTIRLGNIRLNLHTLPRAFFAETMPQERSLGDFDIKDLDCWTVHEPIYIEAPRPPQSGQPLASPENPKGKDTEGRAFHALFRKNLVDVQEYTAERITLGVRAPRDGFVILSDTLRPGWSVRVDGEPSPVFRAQSALRAVQVKKGERTVQWLYRPSSLLFGSAISLAGLALIIGGAAWRVVRRKPGAATSGPL